MTLGKERGDENYREILTNKLSREAAFEIARTFLQICPRLSRIKAGAGIREPRHLA